MISEDKQKQEIADEVFREYERMSSMRGIEEAHWSDIAERMIPSHKDAFNMGAKDRPKGAKNTELIYDSTAGIALSRFAAILDSLLTPRNQTWHRLQPSDPYLLKNREVKLWFEEANRIAFKYRYDPLANFSSQNQQNYTSLGAYGTGCVFTDELKAPGGGLRYRNIHLGEVYFAENHQGIIDKAVRKFALTARQAKQKWGDKLPKLITDQLAIDPEKEYYFIHCVKPNADRDPTRIDYKGMEFGSYYVAEEGKTFLAEEGYTSFPYAISRYEQGPGEVYGRGPAAMVLPAIKTLNEMKKTVLKQGHRAVDPVLLAHDDGVLDSFSLKPGAINAGGVSAEGRMLVQPLPFGKVDMGIDLMEAERVAINDAFLVRLFQILVENPQQTATEVMERAREKGILLAPTLGRQQSEYLGSLIVREMDLLASQGLLPPMPPLLKEAQGEYKIVYDSPLSRAQRAEEASGIMRAVEQTLSIVNVTQDPSLLDHYDFDVIIPEMAEIGGAPVRWMKSVEQIQQMRQARAQQAQVQQATEAAPGVAAVMNAGTKARQA